MDLLWKRMGWEEAGGIWLVVIMCYICLGPKKQGSQTTGCNLRAKSGQQRILEPNLKLYHTLYINPCRPVTCPATQGDKQKNLNSGSPLPTPLPCTISEFHHVGSQVAIHARSHMPLSPDWVIQIYYYPHSLHEYGLKTLISL